MRSKFFGWNFSTQKRVADTAFPIFSLYHHPPSYYYSCFIVRTHFVDLKINSDCIHLRRAHHLPPSFPSRFSYCNRKCEGPARRRACQQRHKFYLSEVSYHITGSDEESHPGNESQLRRSIAKHYTRRRRQRGSAGSEYYSSVAKVEGKGKSTSNRTTTIVSANQKDTSSKRQNNNTDHGLSLVKATYRVERGAGEIPISRYTSTSGVEGCIRQTDDATHVAQPDEVPLEHERDPHHGQKNRSR